MYICEICGTEFDRPTIRRWSEDMDGEGHRESFCQVHCPICGSPYFHREEGEEPA